MSKAPMEYPPDPGEVGLPEQEVYIASPGTPPPEEEEEVPGTYAPWEEVPGTFSPEPPGTEGPAETE
jgi:hypothetical protein